MNSPEMPKPVVAGAGNVPDSLRSASSLHRATVSTFHEKMNLFGKRKQKPYNWKQEHQRLWDAHVPSSGAADTLQGELIRICGKLVDQAYRNGNCNWDDDHETMWRFVGEQITSDPTFDDETKSEIQRIIEEIIRDEACPDLSGDGSTYYRVNEKAVDWCIAHPEPIPFEPDGSYSR